MESPATRLFKSSLLSTAGSHKGVDILDLERFLAETSNPEIIQVFENLLRGSENHVRASTDRAASAGRTQELERGPPRPDDQRARATIAAIASTMPTVWPGRGRSWSTMMAVMAVKAG